MTQNQLVSVITAAYNCQDTIMEAWQSLCNQSYTNWQWIVVNDGSTDNTKAIIDRIEDDRVTVWHFEKNQGVSAARNKGLALMAGDYFCFLDADDLLPANSIKSRYLVFQEKPECDFVDGAVSTFQSDPQNAQRIFSPSFEGNPISNLIGLDGKAFVGNTWMVKRDRNAEYKFLPGLTHGEDLLFFISIARNKHYSFTQDEVLLCRRDGNSAMSNLHGLEMGYLGLKKELSLMKDFEAELVLFRRKAARIMFKSYLKSGRYVDAIRAYARLRF